MSSTCINSQLTHKKVEEQVAREQELGQLRWDLHKVFDVNSRSCVGKYVKTDTRTTRTRCQVPKSSFINVTNVEATMEKMKAKIEKRSLSDSDLEELAFLLLCPKHKEQSSDIKDNWREKLTGLCIPIMISSIKWGTYLLFAVINACLLPVIYFSYLEAKRRSLEGINLFANGYVENISYLKAA
jgi:hypothetical protein